MKSGSDEGIEPPDKLELALAAFRRNSVNGVDDGPDESNGLYRTKLNTSQTRPAALSSVARSTFLWRSRILGATLRTKETRLL